MFSEETLVVLFLGKIPDLLRKLTIKRTNKLQTQLTYPNQHVLRLWRINFTDGDNNSVVSRLLHHDGHLHHHHHHHHDFHHHNEDPTW